MCVHFDLTLLYCWINLFNAVLSVTKPTQIYSLFRSNSPDIKFFKNYRILELEGIVEILVQSSCYLGAETEAPKVINLPRTTLSYLTIIADAFVSCWKAACKTFDSNDAVDHKSGLYPSEDKAKWLRKRHSPSKYSLHLPTIVHLVQASISTQGNDWNCFWTGMSTSSLFCAIHLWSDPAAKPIF